MKRTSDGNGGNQLFAACIVLCAASFASATAFRDDVTDATTRTLSTQAAYAPAGYVSVNNGGGSFLIGSGVLVAPDWVLTAAHVVTQQTGSTATPFAASQVTFGQGASIPGTLTGTFGVSQIVTAPGWSYDFSAGNDLALIHLTAADTAVTPAKLYTTSLGDERTLLGTLVGYGTTGTGSTGATTFDRVRRGTTNTIDAFGGQTTTGPRGAFSLAGNSSNIFFEDFDNPLDTTASSMGATAATSIEGLSAEGDSGGGVYTTVGGATYVTGVTSFGNSFAFSSPTNSGYGDIAGFTRVAPYASFITSTIPEPTSLAIAIAGAIGITLRRRRGR